MQGQLKHILSESDSRGFTIVELIIVVAIIGLVVAISAPRMSEYATNADLRGDATRLMAALKFARMEAVKRNADCSITFGQVVSGTTHDYIVYVDEDADLEFDAAEDVLVFGEYKHSTLKSNTIAVNDDGLRSVRFNGRGIPLNNTNGFSAGTVTLGASTGRERAVDYNSTGRIRIL